MTITNKNRAHFSAIKFMPSLFGGFYLVVPYDKRGKEIPSSVTTAYSAEYYSEEDAMQMSRSL